MCCVDTIYTIHTEVPADWCSDRVQFPVAPKGLDWLFVCIFTIIMCSTDQIILCPIQFCSRSNSVESVPVQWTHQIFQNHSCPDSVSSNDTIFSRTWFSRSYTWSPCTISSEVPADWCSDRVQFLVAPKGLDWLFVCIFTIIMCSKDQVILCSIQFCSRLNSVESVQVQWTHQSFQNHSCPDSITSNNIIF